MKAYCYLLSLHIIVVMLSDITSKKKKKNLEEQRKLKQPSSISQEEYCMSCLIPVTTISNRIKPSNKELEILDVITDSVSQAKGFYNQYKERIRPTLLRDACEAFIVNWEDSLNKYSKIIQKELTNKEYNSTNISEYHSKFKIQLVEKVCFDITAACNGVIEKKDFENKLVSFMKPKVSEESGDL